jgi:hypothetical protein
MKDNARLMAWFDKFLTAGVIGVVAMAANHLSSISHSVQDLNVKIAMIIERQVAQEKVNERQDNDIERLKEIRR